MGAFIAFVGADFNAALTARTTNKMQGSLIQTLARKCGCREGRGRDAIGLRSSPAQIVVRVLWQVAPPECSVGRTWGGSESTNLRPR